MRRSKPFIIGFTFILAIVIFVWGFNFLKGRDLFKKQEFLYARYHTVNGLVSAKPVYVNGLQVGQVSRLYFAPDMSGDIIVELVIQSKFPIPKNSIAHIFSADLMGSKSITLILGDAKEAVESGDTLKTSVEGSLMESVNKQVAPLKAKAELLMGSVDTLIAAFNAVMNDTTVQNLSASIQDIQSTFKNLSSTSSRLDDLVTSEGNRLQSILTNVDSLALTLSNNREGLTNIINNFESISDSLSKANIAEVIHKADSSINSLNQILAKINEGQGTAGKLMNNDSLYRELDKSAEELNKLLKDIRENPKRYVKFSLF
ncbi:MAG: MCE family protein [Bacteroidetes bacterium]|nr:MAG: MCE family protein [Bacteroidota bacterium]